MLAKRPNTMVVTGLVRFSYVHIFKPTAMAEGDDEKYSISIIIPKSDTPTLTALSSAINAAKEEGRMRKWGGKIPTKLKLPLRDGDEDKPEDEAYANSYFINCSSRQKPGIVDENRQLVLDEDAVYSGCYGRVSIKFYPFDVKGSRGVAAGLNNVQKLKDGEPLGGKTSAADDFGDGFGAVQSFDEEDIF